VGGIVFKLEASWLNNRGSAKPFFPRLSPTHLLSSKTKKLGYKESADVTS
jgi:hypothetical protein